MTARIGISAAEPDDAATRRYPERVMVLERVAMSEDEFTEFYRRHLTVIYRFLRSRTSTAQDAEDLVQQVFLNAYRARQGFRGDETARVAWLFRIARNETASWYRRIRPVTVPIDDLRDWHDEPSDARSGPEEHAVTAERDRALAVLVANLSKAEQELIQLRFAAGLSSPEIATVFGCSAGAARQRLHRTLDRLREWSSDDLR
jgi:RNA polymerase sigma-70 factor (ECF subfamily)